LKKYCWVVIVLLLLGATRSRAQETAPTSGATGSVSGYVREITDDFVLVQRPGDLPRREYVDGTAGAELRSAVRALKVGDAVTVGWSFDTKFHLAAIRAARPEEMPVIAATPVASQGAESDHPVEAASAVMPQVAPITLGERVNALLDNLLATGARILDLPVFMVLIPLTVVCGGAAFLVDRRGPVERRSRRRRAMGMASGGLLALVAAVGVDRKFSRLEDQIRLLQTRAQEVAAPATMPSASGRSLMFDQTAAAESLGKVFQNVTLRATMDDPAIDVVRIHTGNPVTQATLAVVNLADAGLEVKLGTNLDEKSLTSQFAKKNGCLVAINGEAGMSPAPGSGLGSWRGFLAYHGQVLLKEDPRVPRPFLAFDATNRATLTAAEAQDRSLPAPVYNVLWGRLDAVVNGVVQTADERYRQPRTAMGISADGTRLFLLVVDGRQPRYSMGYTRAEVGQVMKAFGAANAMLCDEGGSSCMYVAREGGIVNEPSDGEERVTYTHFGVGRVGGR
jgi:exopolysaccharide biosynthesis protein